MTARRTYMAAMVLAFVFTCAQTSQAQGFSDRSLKGSCGWAASGTLNGDPAAAAGINTFDGKGGCTSSARLDWGGQALTMAPVSCEYSVNPDGTGTLVQTYLVPELRGMTLGPITTELVIVGPNADEFFFVAFNAPGAPPVVASGSCKRQR